MTPEEPLSEEEMQALARQAAADTAEEEAAAAERLWTALGEPLDTDP